MKRDFASIAKMGLRICTLIVNRDKGARGQATIITAPAKSFKDLAGLNYDICIVCVVTLQNQIILGHFCCRMHHCINLKN